MIDSRKLKLCAITAALALVTPAVLAQYTGESVIQTGGFSEDLYLAGAQVTASADVTGDVVAAGARVTVERRVTGSVLAAGGVVGVNATVGNDLRAAGGMVNISGPIGDDATVIGGNITLAPNARVGGRAWFAGGQIDVAGEVAKKLTAAGGQIIISGTINRDAELTSDAIDILSSAVIKGNLHTRGHRPPHIAPGAQIGGRISYEPLPAPTPTRALHAAGTGARIAVVAGLIVAGIVLFLVLPNFSVRAARTIDSDSWKSLGLGLVVLIVGPVAAVMLIVTVIGAPLGLVLLALYAVSLLIGYLIGALYLGDAGLRWLGKGPELPTGLRVLSIAAALLALAIVQLVPLIGRLTTLAVLLFGLGALKLEAIRAYSAIQQTRISARTKRRQRR
jgi:cytoskeletal protein CcmA (bactofilin family)